MEFIDVLESRFYRNTVTFTFNIDNFMHGIFIPVDAFDKPYDTFRLVIGNALCFTASPVFKADRQVRIQISSLMQTIFHFLRFKYGMVKNFIIRHKPDTGSCIFGFSDNRQKPVLQLYRRNTAFICILIDMSAAPDPYFHPDGKCIDDRRTDTMQSPACLISGIVKFTTCMKRRKNKTFRTDPFFMQIDRNTTSVILYSHGTVLFQINMYLTAITGKMLINCIIHDLVDQMVQSFCRHTTDIHTRSDTDCLQSFQHRYIFCIICLFWHTLFPLYFYNLLHMPEYSTLQ